MWTARISNAIALLLILVMASGLLGHLVPWDWTPRDSLSGQKSAVGTAYL